MFELTLEKVSKRFGATKAVEEVSFAVRAGEWFSLLGPSGCGKTTLLRMIAGFTKPDSGRITINGHDVTDLPPYRRNTGMVFQNYALFPHLTTGMNVAYGLRIRSVSRAETARRVEAALALVQLSGFGNRYPTRELSGGQQQRVALARALVIEPDVLLLDEPLSNLDAKLRDDLCVEMAQLQRQLQLTTVYVTHAQDEALSMSSRIAVMNKGQIEQIGTPMEIYQQPASAFVADFIGKINQLPGLVAEPQHNGRAAVQLCGTGPILRIMSEANFPIGSELSVGIRPECIGLRELGASVCGDGLVGKVQHVAFYGKEIGYKIDLGRAGTITATVPSTRDSVLQQGVAVEVRLSEDDCMILRK